MMRNDKRWWGLLAGAGLIALAAGPLPAGAVGQECTQLAAEAEQQMETATLTDIQREYILDLIGTARTFAEKGDRQGCMENLTDLAEYVDQERIDLPVAARIGSRPSALGDTQETGSGARGQPPEGTVEPSEPTETDERAPAATGG